MKMRNYTFRQMVKIIEANGFEYVRCTGDHFIYKKKGERNTITLAKNKHVNPCIARRLIKECNLKVDLGKRRESKGSLPFAPLFML